LAIEFNCPHCGKLLTTADERASQRAKCPACGDLITVPAPASTLVGGVPSAALEPTAAWGVSSTPPSNPFPSATPGTASYGTSPGTQAPSSAPPEYDRSGYSAPGQSAVKTCPNCRREIDAKALYCPGCGVALWEPPLFRYAAFWRRAVAALIDLALITVTLKLIEFILLGGTWMTDKMGFVVWFVYHSAFEGSTYQATFGKQLMGIVVCGCDGRRLNFPRAAIRTLAKLLSLLICGVGYLMPLLTLRKQALHDVLTDAVVVAK
jgi:uncharacterized RDD family membrane protein YckC/phage FluMu protein Com